ncbi:MAG TPA: PP2C family protein-serine/threonine phosphatase [Phycisphaerae bacterium]|nr:PP2C family protein-serine/threonine phosphatase [Phycisphaerae bacterium]
MPKDNPFIPPMPPALRFRLYAGVFLMFGTIGLLFDLCLLRSRPPLGVAVMAVLTGLISVGWCHAFQSTFRWIIVILPFSILAPMLFDFALPRHAVSYQIRGGFSPRHAADALAVGVMLVGGYSLIVSFIRNESKRHERLETEMALAKRIHDSLVPPIAFKTPQIEVFGRSVASSAVGGDLLDAVNDGKSATLFIADVSGHGVGAGVLMAMIKSAIRMRLREGGTLDAVVNDLNRVVHELTRPDAFATFSCLRFSEPGKAAYAIAGHLSILVYRCRSSAVEELPNDHLPLGVMGEESYTAKTVAYDSGDLFVLLTDGFMETLNGRDEQFGEERIKELIVRNGDRPLPFVYETLTAAVNAHGPAGDDQTLLLARAL